MLAVLEFYCRAKLTEDQEAIAAAEMVAASLGQTLARSQEQGRAAELSLAAADSGLDTVTDGICGVDREGLVTFANPAAARLLGAPAAKINSGMACTNSWMDGSGPHCGQDCALKQAAEHGVAALAKTPFFALTEAPFRQNMC